MKFSKRAGEYVNKWGIILDEQSRAHDEARRATSIKREHEDDEDVPKKKVKSSRPAKGLEGMSTDELRAAIANGTLGKSTAMELKGWLQSKGITASGKKQDLLDRVEQWVEDA